MEPTMGHAPLHHDERNPGLVYLLQLLQSACFNPSPDNWQVSQAIWRGSFVKMEDERCMRPAQLACKSQCTSDLDPLPDALFHPATGRGVPICANARKLPGHIRAALDRMREKTAGENTADTAGIPWQGRDLSGPGVDGSANPLHVFDEDDGTSPAEWTAVMAALTDGSAGEREVTEVLVA